MTTTRVFALAFGAVAALGLARLSRGPFPEPANTIYDIARITLWPVVVAHLMHRRNRQPQPER